MWNGCHALELGVRILQLLVHFKFVGTIPEAIQVRAIDPKVI
jgi:hypothetical protein